MLKEPLWSSRNINGWQVVDYITKKILYNSIQEKLYKYLEIWLVTNYFSIKFI